MTERLEYAIQGGDYDGGGRASRDLKERLKRMGIEPVALRRAMVAAYEAEMNVVIHAQRGRLCAVVSPGQLEVEVEDEGPGIPDVARAMQVGFSTAPARARELGFGAGMGLPNIRKNADWFELESWPGRGTRLRFRVTFGEGTAAEAARPGVRVAPGLCSTCRRCLAACPTQALRLHGAEPTLLAHLCIACTACAAACPRGVFQAEAGPEAEVEIPPGADVVLPAVWLAGFAPRRSPAAALAALGALGAGRVILLDGYLRAHRAAAAGWRPSVPGPALSLACPAAVELVRLRFPSLLPLLAPFLTPLEAAARDLGEGPALLVASCPAEQARVVGAGLAAGVRLVHPEALRRRLWAALEAAPDGRATEAGATARDAAELPAPGWLRVTGLGHLRACFEALEDGQLDDLEGLEGWACDQGCAGSAWMGVEPHLARHRLRRCPPASAVEGRAYPRVAPLRPRAGVRLDPHLPTAVQRLREVDRTLGRLAGIDCGLCGAPSCATFAEDVVLGRAQRADCPYPDREEVEEP